MQAKWNWVHTSGWAALGTALLFSCGTDEAIHQHPTTPIIPSGGKGSATAGSSTAGSSSGNSTQLGGMPGAPEAGSDAGGAPSAAGMGGDQAEAGMGAGGSPGPGEQLSFCSRLTMRTARSVDVTADYDLAVFEDCRTKWLNKLYLPDHRAPFLNELVTWNLAFWGCQDEPVEDFKLVYGTPALSAGDAALVIERYVAEATRTLEMSLPEIEEMQAALERLAKPLITDASSEPSKPDCDAGTGGAGGVDAGGAAGAPLTAAAGHGGTP